VHAPAQAGDSVLVVQGVGGADVSGLDRGGAQHLLDGAVERRPVAEAGLDLSGHGAQATRVGVAECGEGELVVAGLVQVAIAGEMGAGNAAAADEGEL